MTDELDRAGDVDERRSALEERQWEQPWKGPLLAAVSRMPNASAACRIVGISLSNLKYARRTDTEFASAFKEAVEIGLDFLEQILHTRATLGEPRSVVRTRRRVDADGKMIEEETIETTSQEIDNQLLLRLLEAYRPERWARGVEHRHRGDPETPIQVEVYRRPSPERVLELSRIALDLAEAEAGPPTIEGEATEVDP